MLYEFKSGYNIAEVTKNIFCVKGECWSKYSIQMIEEILFGLQEPP